MKRQRTSGIEYEVKDGFIIIMSNGRQYAWYPPINGSVETFLNQQSFMYEIIHNNDGQAMFNVENLRTDERVLRQEINPLIYKDVENWMKDE